ncbi:MAG: DUF2470 domain-containing protein [Pseudomonadota bacterium]
MTEQVINDSDKARIIDHMNDDHSDACLLYVHHFAERQDAQSARLTDVQADHMTLEITVESGTEEVSIPFATPLQSSEDAHHTLVAMVRQAREQG